MSILEDDIDNLYQTSLAITRNVHIEFFTAILSPKMSNLPEVALVCKMPREEGRTGKSVS